MNKTALKTLIQGLEHRLELAAKKKQEESDVFGQISYHFVMAGLQTGIEDAKKLLDLEKEQIMDAWNEGMCIQDTNDICAEYYYNETYNNE